MDEEDSMRLFQLESFDGVPRDTVPKALVDPGHGLCSTEYVRGREALRPESGLLIDLAECEFLRSIREV